jgi:mono/diheme cytochrome c family protein
VAATSAVVVLACLLSLRRRRRPWLLVVAALFALVVGVTYSWPPLGWLPPAFVRADPPYGALARALSMPPVRPPPPARDVSDPEERALVEHGRYVATVGTCPLCHTAGPSPTRPFAPFPEMGGGMKVNWRVFGTTYSRNLTPDRETGLGEWSDNEIRRAITGGISRDGRLMHWQAMPWDHFSSFRPEDLEALIAYLRHLPPRRSRVPDPEPPRPGDEAADTFWFGYYGELRPGHSASR